MAGLADLAEAIRSGRQLSPDQAARAADILDAAAVGDRRAALASRDRALLDAGEFLPSLTSHARAAALHSELTRYQTSAWSRDRILDNCPTRYVGTIRANLWHALKANDAVPSARTIRRLLAISPPVYGQRASSG